MQHNITRADFNTWAAENASRLEPYGFPMNGTTNMAEDGTDFFDELDYCFGSVASGFSVMMMTQNGFTITGDSVSFNMKGLRVIDAHASRVLGDYDNQDGRSTKDPDSPWVLFTLGGDDDVDYNGSYVSAGCSALELFVDGFPVE